MAATSSSARFLRDTRSSRRSRTFPRDLATSLSRQSRSPRAESSRCQRKVFTRNSKPATQPATCRRAADIPFFKICTAPQAMMAPNSTSPQTRPPAPLMSQLLLPPARAARSPSPPFLVPQSWRRVCPGAKSFSSSALLSPFALFFYARVEVPAPQVGLSRRAWRR